MKYILSIIALIVSAGIITGCNQEDPDKKRIAEANAGIQQKNTANFDPAISASQANTHIGYMVNFTGTTFTVDSASVSVRNGKLPYLSDKGLPFEVIYKSADGNILGSYRRSSPLTIQSCDEGSQPHIKKLTSGSFELLLPNNLSIAAIELKENDSAVARFKVPIRRPGNLPGQIDTTGVKKQ